VEQYCFGEARKTGKKCEAVSMQGIRPARHNTDRQMAMAVVEILKETEGDGICAAPYRKKHILWTPSNNHRHNE